jgi:hypothetical protein
MGGVDPEALKLNLDMLYADGPIGTPYLFDLADPAKFPLVSDGEDVPRNPQGVALIGDPRNDVHLFSPTAPWPHATCCAATPPTC